MTVKIHRVFHLDRNIRVGVFRDIADTVSAADIFGAVRKFVSVSAALHTKMTDDVKGDIFGQNREIELTRLLDDLAGEIAFLTRNGDADRIPRHLKSGVDNTSVFLFAAYGQDKQTVGQLEQGG